jgi:hypothetical protein
VNKEDFNEYLIDLIRFRKEDRRSGGGAFSPDELQNVYGVTAEGDAITVSLQEYCKECIPELHAELTLDLSNIESHDIESSDNLSPY